MMSTFIQITGKEEEKKEKKSSLFFQLLLPSQGKSHRSSCIVSLILLEVWIPPDRYPVTASLFFLCNLLLSVKYEAAPQLEPQSAGDQSIPTDV